MAELSEKHAPKILIADDDPAILRFLERRCVKMGFEVHTSSNGLQALLAARRTRPDVVIADLNMPEVDGLTMSVKLISLNSWHLDIILISASNFRETPGRSHSLGLFYVPKGLELWRGVRAALAEIFPATVSATDEEDSHAGSTAEIGLDPRVLLIDDDPDLGAFLKSRLKKLGVDLVLATDGAHALQYSISKSPTVIISNYLMPNCDAHYLLMKLRATATTKRVPLVIVSNHDLDSATKVRLNAYAPEYDAPIHYLVKPFDTDVLFDIIQKYCSFRTNPSIREEYLYSRGEAAGA